MKPSATIRLAGRHEWKTQSTVDTQESRKSSAHHPMHKTKPVRLWPHSGRYSLKYISLTLLLAFCLLLVSRRSDHRQRDGPSDTTIDLLSEEEENGWLLEPLPVRLELRQPMYNVRVLRSILHHSNNSWQDMPGEAQGYFLQSLLWLQIVGGIWCRLSSEQLVVAIQSKQGLSSS